ncbi:MAG: J domain-containing protein, partial [Candidatus Poseidoniales archaeon]
MSGDAYDILGVSSDATDAHIKRNYRRLARQYHPDRNPDDQAAEERFKSIQTAYEQIGTTESRAEYDQKIRMEEMFRGGRRSTFNGGFGGFDIGDIFSQFRNSGRDNISNQRPDFDRQEENVKGSNIESGLDISLNQAIDGANVKFSHRRFKVCEKCNGSTFGTSRNCSVCGGKGVKTKKSTITIKVP